MRARILLVGAERLESLLASEDFEVALAASGASGFARASEGDFDLIVLDETPAVCDALRRKGVDTSILMITEERVAGLRRGADDCVSRSCDSSELLARIEALLRRSPSMHRRSVTTLRLGDVEIDFRIHEVRKCGLAVSMSQKELALLQYLVDHRHRVVSREEILKHVWEYDSAVASRTVDVHIGWLRQKLEDDPQQPKYIKTIRGRGYRFDQDRAGAVRSSLSGVSN